MQNIHDSVLDSPFTKCHGGQAMAAPTGGKRQKRHGVFLADAAAHPAQHRFITGPFHIFGKEMVRQPCQRVKPVEQGDDKYRGLNQIIPAAQMDLFMEENIFPFFLP